MSHSPKTKDIPEAQEEPKAESTINPNHSQPDHTRPSLNNKSLHSEVIDLQAKVAYLELAVDSLDTVISKQDKQLQDILRQMQLLFSHSTHQTQNAIAPFDATNEVPPHY